jgi:phosphoribosylformylglycinamidine cyclo-ligase
MYRTFNMGIGFVLIVNKKDVGKVLTQLKKYDFSSQVIGKVVGGNKEVIIN